MLRPVTVGTILGSVLLAVGCVASMAQEPKPGSDDALDSLIEKLSDSPSTTSDAKPKSDDRSKSDEKSGPAKEAESAKSKTNGPKPADADKGSAEDQELDSLLEKLGGSSDEPDTANPKQPPQPGRGAGRDRPDGSKSQQPKTGEMSKKDQELDERLEELTGRKKKKKSDSDDENSGPTSELVKQMREIEQRVGKADTGAETQEKQKQIVKRLETMIEQARQSGSSSSSSQMKLRQVKQAGQKPGGSQQGQQQEGANAGGAPSTRPAKPTTQRSLAGGKDIWGHLPPELRQEMENSFKEEALPDKIELIRRYYLSVSKNKPARGE